MFVTPLVGSPSVRKTTIGMDPVSSPNMSRAFRSAPLILVDPPASMPFMYPSAESMFWVEAGIRPSFQTVILSSKMTMLKSSPSSI